MVLSSPLPFFHSNEEGNPNSAYETHDGASSGEHQHSAGLLDFNYTISHSLLYILFFFVIKVAYIANKILLVLYTELYINNTS